MTQNKLFVWFQLPIVVFAYLLVGKAVSMHELRLVVSWEYVNLKKMVVLSFSMVYMLECDVEILYF
jgi:hypothetical protein